MEFETVETVLKYMSKNDITSVTWTGGEPTLHPRLPDMIDLAHDYGINNTIITHGIGLKDNVDILSYKLDDVIISMDAADRETYHSIRGVDGFHELQKLPAFLRYRLPGVGVAVCFLIQQLNIDSILDFIAMADRLKVDRVAFLVPDIKGYINPDTLGSSFGHIRPSDKLFDRIPPTPEQVDALEAKLPQIFEACESACFDSPTAHQIPNYINYFRRFHSGTPLHDNPPCLIPKHEAVVTVDGHIKPCFFVPEKHLVTPDSDPFFSPAMINHRNLLEFDEAYRNTHCRDCLQTLRSN